LGSTGDQEWKRNLSLNAVPKKYDEAFKRQAVEMVLRGGKTVKQAAEELAPRLQAELRHRGHRHSRKRIDRIRRELGPCGHQKRRYRPRTTDSAHDEPIHRVALAVIASAPFAI